jgi:hypothetical protein
VNTVFIVDVCVVYFFVDVFGRGMKQSPVKLDGANNSEVVCVLTCV